ncbi:PucR family transcriptional regulator [Solibacillus sp. FSL K6-1523]|uniref:PucR family transcriptional regulator n=1 Tax=Solibacillus sp. FSL K6-1523 TaxID=2921471 RepID=UPI0030F4D388
MNDFSLTVSEVMTKKLFSSARLIAGAKGQLNVIKWVHIVESLDAAKLLKGNELILTTGIHLKDNEEIFKQFIHQLIASKAAGLCIELGNSIQEIPHFIQQMATDYQFPLIIFHKEVAFVEITQDIHSMLINQQYEMIKNLEDYAQQLNKYTLTVNNYEQILMHLYKHLGLQVIFTFNGQKPIFIPNIYQEKYEAMQQANPDDVENHFIQCDVNIFNQYYGEVCLFSSQRVLNEYDALILDRTVIALSQYLLRELYIEEKKGMEDREILDNWLNGKATIEELTHFMQDHHASSASNRWIVMIHQIQKRKSSDVTYYKLFARNVLEKFGFYPFILEKNSQLIFILADLREQESYKQRIEQALAQIHDNNSKYKYADLNFLYAVGKYVSHIQTVKNSYTTANDTLEIRWKSQELSCFYEDLHLHHLILHLQKSPSVMDMIAETIYPLIEYDQKHNSQLVETLKVYLQTNGLKKETSERLFIVRQTLYHRLEKIEQLLGHDFMKPEKRLTLELMLFASELLPVVHE